MTLARKTGDRYRDIDQAARDRVLCRFRASLTRRRTCAKLVAMRRHAGGERADRMFGEDFAGLGCDWRSKLRRRSEAAAGVHPRLFVFLPSASSACGRWSYQFADRFAAVDHRRRAAAVVVEVQVLRRPSTWNTASPSGLAGDRGALRNFGVGRRFADRLAHPESAAAEGQRS